MKTDIGNSTKSRILKTCLALFNEQGVAAVNSKTMSAQLGISQGNLAYHFPKKQDIIMELFDQRKAAIVDLFYKITKEYNASKDDLFPDFFKFISSLMGIISAYRFVSIDLGYLMRKYPQIAKEWTIENATMGEVTRGLFILGVKDGFIKPEPYKGAFANHIHRMQVFLNFCAIDGAVRGLESAHYSRLLYDDVSSLLTEKGINLFVGHFPKTDLNIN